LLVLLSPLLVATASQSPQREATVGVNQHRTNGSRYLVHVLVLEYSFEVLVLVLEVYVFVLVLVLEHRILVAMWTFLQIC